MDVSEGEEDDNAGDDDCNDDVEDVEGVTYADAEELYFVTCIKDAGGRLLDGVVDIECVTVADG